VEGIPRFYEVDMGEWAGTQVFVVGLRERDDGRKGLGDHHTYLTMINGGGLAVCV
jgi:hypothetical protein